MNFFAGLLLGLVSTTTAWAQAQAFTPLIDYLRTTPAVVAGHITPIEKKMVSNPTTGVWVNLNKNKPISYSFNEHYLSIKSDGGITIKVAGIACWVKSIEYTRNGNFKVKTSTPLGIAQGLLNRKVEEALGSAFKDKMARAFESLDSMRSQRSVTDASRVIRNITDIFSARSAGSAGFELPDFNGGLYLNFTPSGDKTLSVGAAQMDIKEGQLIQAGVDFTIRSKKFTINALSFNSPDGVRIRPIESKDKKDIASAVVKSVSLDETGIKLDYTTGPEDLLTGVALVASLVLAESQNVRASIDCNNPVQIDSIRKMIDGRVSGQLALLIRDNRRSLLASGISPAVLNALD